MGPEHAVRPVARAQRVTELNSFDGAPTVTHGESWGPPPTSSTTGFTPRFDEPLLSSESGHRCPDCDPFETRGENLATCQTCGSTMNIRSTPNE